MTDGHITLSILLACIGIFWGYWADKSESRKEMANLIQEQKDWMVGQNLQSRYRIRVETNGGIGYTSSPFEPTCEVDWMGEYYLNRDSSKCKAERAIENSIRLGRYVHADTGIYVPLCEIKSFEVVKV